MNANDAMILSQIRALPLRARAAFALALADMVMLEMAGDPQGLAVAREALGLAWKWVRGAPVRGEDIEQYVSSSTDKNLGRFRLRHINDGATLAAIVVADLAVSYVARKAFDAEGPEDMSSVLWEVTEDLFEDLFGYARETVRYDEAAAQRVSRFLVDRYSGQGPTVLGVPVTPEEVLPLINDGRGVAT